MSSMECDQSKPPRGSRQADRLNDPWRWLEEPWVTDAVRDGFRCVPYERLALHADGRPVIQTTDPKMMARMLCGLHVEPGMRVLEIGTGSGYNAALLRRLVGEAGTVATVEVDPRVARAARRRWAALRIDGIESVIGDGWHGHGSSAPYDRIIATCKPHGLPNAWVAHLKDGGILATPLDLRGLPGTTVVVYFRKASASRLESIGIHRSGFVPMGARPDEVISQPWKRAEADVVLWCEQGAREPALWLHLPWASPAARRHIASALLQEPREEPLPFPCDSRWAFWMQQVAAGETEATLSARTAPGYDLPESGFGYCNEERGVAYLELGTKRGILLFGDPGSRHQRLLAGYRAWCERGQPGVDALRITASPADGEWAMSFDYAVG